MCLSSTLEKVEKSVTVSSINAYQARQLKHDKVYHREIWSLGVSRGMIHVALHLTKYLARLSALPVSSKENKRDLIDSFIMIISAGNLLNLAFGKVLLISSPPTEEQLPKSFISEYIRLLAEMAKACEATDHQEDYPIRAVWNRNLKDFFVLLLIESEKRDINIVEEATNRLIEVEDNHALNEIFQEIY